MKRVLVPLDGSSFAELAIPVAVEVAQRRGASLAFVVAHEPPGVAAEVHAPAPLAVAATGGGLDRFDEATLRSDQRYLDSIVSQSSARFGDAIDAVLLSGPPAPALISHIRDASDDQRPDLVVMSTHGRGGLTRFWLGSVADSLIRHVTVPLLLVKLRRSSGTVSLAAPAFRRVMVPLDGSTLSERAVEPAIDVCGTIGVQYVLVTVTEPVTAIASAALAAQTPPPDDDANGPAERYLLSVAARLQARGLAVQILPAVHTNPARLLLDLMEEIDCDLIAMTTHGRGGFRRAILGSVADKVIRAAERPVLVWRPDA